MSLHHRGDSAEIAPTLNVKLWLLVVVVVARSQVFGTAEPDPLFVSIRTSENTFESSPKTLLGNFDPVA
jgi:hypothetical protein